MLEEQDILEGTEETPEVEGDAETLEPEASPATAEVVDEAETPLVEVDLSSLDEGDEDFDVVFDDDLGPSLAEELAALSLADSEEDAEPESDEDLVESEAKDGRNWFVIHCYSGYENKVRHNLEQRIETMSMQDKIFDVVVPTEDEIEVKEGKRRTVERRVFPGYILVQMILTEDSWYVVRNTPGVTGFVGMGNTPTPLQEKEVSQIIKRMEAEAPRVKLAFKQGQKVRIIDGPFNDIIGTVGEIDMERGKVRVMVSFFGRETPVELDFLQVEKI